LRCRQDAASFARRVNDVKLRRNFHDELRFVRSLAIHIRCASRGSATVLRAEPFGFASGFDVVALPGIFVWLFR